MPPLYMPSAISDRASFELIACYEEGVKEGINRVWQTTDGTSLVEGVSLPNIFDAVRVAPSTTAENVYTFASTNYAQVDTSGDQTPDFTSTLYEHLIANRRPKKRGLKADLIDWSDSKIDKFRVMFHEAGTAAVVAPYRLLVNTMRNGRIGGLSTNPILQSGIDGRDFWGTHYTVPGDSSTPAYSNSVIIPALTQPEFAKAWGAFVQFPGEDGQPLGARPSILAVGPLDFDAAINIAYMEKPSGGAGGGNTYRGRVHVAFVPEWGDGTCMLLDTNSALTRAFIFQEREPNRIVPVITNPNEPLALLNSYLYWLLMGRYEVGVGHFRCAYRMGRVAP